MVRTVRGVTLTPEERRQAGYDRQPAQGQKHACSVVLPDGTSCEVSYTRTSPRVHAFAFGAPLWRTHHAYEAIPGGTAGIEEKAAALAHVLFRQAQQQEQKAMRLKIPSRPAAYRSDGGPQISARLAEQLAGLYAPCVRCASGTLIRVGGTYADPEGAQREIQSGRHAAIRLMNGQRLTVGICSRAAQRWEEPRFLGGATSAPLPDAPGEGIHEEDPEDEEWPAAVGSQEGDPVGGEGYGDD